jgi:hypothetical protein
MIKINDDRFLVWTGGAAIDCDGSPRAYGPNNTGLDYTANAGSPGNYYGILTDIKGIPIIQGMNDPYPGMYISPSSLQDKGYKPTDTRRYVDSESVPYIAVPKDALKLHNVKLGDICAVYNKKTDKSCVGIVADAGPTGKWTGELSMAMGKSIGIKNVSPRNGGQTDGIIYLVFKGSTKGWPRPEAEISDQATLLVELFGGISKLKIIINNNL